MVLITTRIHLFWLNWEIYFGFKCFSVLYIMSNWTSWSVTTRHLQPQSPIEFMLRLSASCSGFGGFNTETFLNIQQGMSQNFYNFFTVFQDYVFSGPPSSWWRLVGRLSRGFIQKNERSKSYSKLKSCCCNGLWVNPQQFTYNLHCLYR